MFLRESKTVVVFTVYNLHLTVFRFRGSVGRKRTRLLRFRKQFLFGQSVRSREIYNCVRMTFNPCTRSVSPSGKRSWRGALATGTGSIRPIEWRHSNGPPQRLKCIVFSTAKKHDVPGENKSKISKYVRYRKTNGSYIQTRKTYD